MSSTARRLCLCLVLVALAGLFGIGGCGTSDGDDAAPITSAFRAVPPVFSRVDNNGSHWLANSSDDSDTRSAVRNSNSTPPPLIMERWFYLVNGKNIDEVDQGLAQLCVLGVDNSLKNGVPIPNSDSSAVIASPQAGNNTLLWKAVPVDESDESSPFYLRSNLSFTTGYGPYPNILVGYGAAGGATIPLDLGYIVNSGSFVPAIYLNQQRYENGEPTGDYSDFQQWTYDNATGQIINFPTGWALAYGDGLPVIGGSNATLMTWYTFPNYYLDYIYSWPQSDPAFPSWYPEPLDSSMKACRSNPTTETNTTSDGQNAAYYWISDYYYAPNGIRDYYTDTDSQAVSDCASGVQTLAYPSNAAYNNVPFTELDFQIMSCQLHNETFAVESVTKIWGSYENVLNQIFITNTSLFSDMATTLSLVSTTKVSASATDVMEDVLHTSLTLANTALPGIGALSNIMSLAYTATMAQEDSASAFSTCYTSEVGDIYGDLAKSFEYLIDSANNGLETILGDWNKLKAVAELTVQTGYNGLASLGVPETQSQLVNAGINAYTLYAAQTLFPQIYDISINPGQVDYAAVDAQIGDNTADLTTSNLYSTFGSQTGSFTFCYYCTQEDLDLSNTEGDITGFDQYVWPYGANEYDVYMGINGWNGFDTDYRRTVIGCYGTVVTFYNNTSSEILIEALTTQGAVAVPGAQNYVSNKAMESSSIQTYMTWDDATGYFYIPAYGYAPVWISSDKKNMAANFYLSSLSDNLPVYSFAIEGDGCSCKVPSYITSAEQETEGWTYTSFTQPQSDYYDSPVPAGIVINIYND